MTRAVTPDAAEHLPSERIRCCAAPATAACLCDTCRTLETDMMMPQDFIRKIAYAIWEKEGRPDGKDLDHWFRATAIFRSTPPAPVVIAPGRGLSAVAPALAGA